MKKLLAAMLSLCLILTSTAIAVSSPVSADDYTLVWSDEFDGAGINPWNWTLDQGVRNGERQTYKLENASVHDGMLDILGECTVVDDNGNVMPAGQVSSNTRDVKSASLKGCGKQAFKFGMVEVRAKLPNACSSWPAFWTCGWDKYGEDKGQGGSNWPANGEIDFMEMMCVNSENETVSPFGKKNKDKEYEVHLHCGAKDDDGVFRDAPVDPGNIYNPDGKQLAYEWHTYGMIWEENQIQFTMDGVVRITVDTSDEALLEKAAQKYGGTDSDWYKLYKTQLETEGNPFNDFEHCFLLNFAIGGAGTEYRFYSDEWPQHLLIDYIRVYQKPNSGATHNETLLNSPYNTWYGKGLLDGSTMAQNWIDDPVYGGQQTEDSGVTVGTTQATVSTTTSGQVVTNTTTSNSSSTTTGTIIDRDTNTNYYDESSTLTPGVDCITAVKSSGANLITSTGNNIAPYDGLKFTVTPNSGNEKTAVVVKVDGVSKSFALGSGTTECSVTFDELGVTPTSSSTIFFGAEGDGATNLTIGNVYGFIGTGSSETPTESSSLTPVETESTTSGSSSDTPTPSGAMIDWDINNNWYVVSGSNNETKVITNDNLGIRVYSYGSGRIIGTYNNDTTNFDGVKFTAIAPDPTNTSGLRVQIDGVETEYITLSSSATTFTLDFAELGVTPSSTTEINFEVNGVIDVLISDIEGYTTSGEEEKPSETEPSQTQPSDTDSDVLVDWSTKDNWWNDGSVTTDNATDGFVKATTIASSNKNIIGTYNLDLSNYDGILFTAKGSGTLRIKIGSYEGFGGTASKYLRLSDTEKTFNINFEACSVETTNTEFVLQVEAGSVDIIISDVIGYNLDDKTTSYSVTIDGTTLQNTSAFIGNDFVFPESSKNGFIAYTDGENYYDECEKMTLSSDVTFSTVAIGELQMLTGASIRLGKVNGLRFYTVADTESLAKLPEGALVTKGTLITPKDLLGNEDLTHYASCKKIDVFYNSESYYQDDDTFVGSIVNIKETTEKNPTSGNIAREFLGRGYITVKLSDYEKTVYADYSDYNINNNRRSLAYTSYYYKANNYNDDGISSYYKNLVDGWAAFYEPTV